MIIKPNDFILTRNTEYLRKKQDKIQSFNGFDDTKTETRLNNIIEQVIEIFEDDTILLQDSIIIPIKYIKKVLTEQEALDNYPEYFL